MIADRWYDGDVERAKATLTYSRFVTWVEYFRREGVKREKADYYAAGVRIEIVRLRRQLVGIFQKPEGKEPELDDYLMEAADGETEERPKKKRSSPVGVITPDHPDYLMTSKMAMAAQLGILPETMAKINK